MWKQGGRSSALERAQAALSSRRGRETSATPRAPVSVTAEPLSSHSGSSLSSVPEPGGRVDHRPGAAHVPHPKSSRAPESCVVDRGPEGRPFSSLDSGANRFLKKSPGAAVAARDQTEERAMSTSLGRGSQTAALSRLAQVENRFGKAVQKSPSGVGRTVVRDIPVEHTVVARPHSDRPTRFGKSRPQQELREDGLLGQSASSERSAQQLQSPAHLSTASPRVTSSVQAQTPPELSPSPPELSPSPRSLSPSAASGLGDVHSLEELFPLDEASEDTSEHFQINLMDLEELEPAAPQLEELEPAAPQLEEVTGEKTALSWTVQEEIPGDFHEEPREEEYQSDFESVIQTESLSEHTQESTHSPSAPLSEHTQGSTHSPSAPLSEHTQGSTQRPSPPHSELSYSKSSTRSSSEARSAEAPLCLCQTPSAKHKPAQTSHRPAHSGCSPSLELLMDSLRQQLALTSRFISSSREHRERVLQNLGPPSYTYTTLQDTHEYIWKLRVSRAGSEQLTGRR